MSGLRDKIQAQLARYDDDAFAALANRGLLRRARKDLEKETPRVEQETADQLALAFGGHRIEFDARGATHARCSCPANGTCQHILAAAIYLQGSPAASTETTPAEAAPAGSSSASADSSTPSSAPSPILGADSLATLRDAVLAFSARE